MDAKKLIIGASIAGVFVAGIFLKNKYLFKPLQKDILLKILKKTRKKNFFYLKQIAILATQINNRKHKFDRQLIQNTAKQAKFLQTMEKNLNNICIQQGTTINQFNDNIQYYVNQNDTQVIEFIKEAQKLYQDSLLGKLAQPKVQIPKFLTKQKLIEIHKKLTQKKFLINIQNFRLLKNIRPQQYKQPQIMRQVQHPQIQQQKILQSQGLGIDHDPPTSVFIQAMTKYTTDNQLKKSIAENQKHYRQIYNKHLPKLRNKNITMDQINQIEDQFIYS